MAIEMTLRESALLNKVAQMLGREPVGMLDLIHILSHPDVIELTRQYLEGKGETFVREFEPTKEETRLIINQSAELFNHMNNCDTCRFKGYERCPEVPKLVKPIKDLMESKGFVYGR